MRYLLLSHADRHDGFLRVEAVFRLVENFVCVSLENIRGYLLSAVSREAVHDKRVGFCVRQDVGVYLIAGKDLYGTPEEKAFIKENFPACPNVSIDFGIMEKAENVYVSLGDFGWSDLGTWGSLYDLSPKDENGNVTLKCDSLIYNSKDNIVVLPQGKLAVIEGLEGFLVAESDNVLLICKKDEEHAIRKYVNDAQIKLGDDYI